MHGTCDALWFWWSIDHDRYSLGPSADVFLLNGPMEWKMPVGPTMTLERWLKLVQSKPRFEVKCIGQVIGL